MLPSLHGEYLTSTAAPIRQDRVLLFTEGLSALLGVWIWLRMDLTLSLEDLRDVT